MGQGSRGNHRIDVAENADLVMHESVLPSVETELKRFRKKMFDAPPSPKPSLYDLVCSLLDTAVEKGPTALLTERPEAVAVHLATHCVELDLHGGWRHVHELAPLVGQWQTARRAKVPRA